MIRYNCDSCNSLLESEERRVGNKVVCPTCKAELFVPAISLSNSANSLPDPSRLSQTPTAAESLQQSIAKNLSWIAAFGSVIRIVTWLIVLAWSALCFLNWIGSTPENAIQQCVLAAQTAAALIAGYVVARAGCFMTKEAESLIEEKK